MSNLTKCYKELAKLEVELEECFNWVDKNQDNLIFDLTIVAPSEGRNSRPPRWLENEIQKTVHTRLPGFIHKLLEKKVLEYEAAEQAFLEEAQQRTQTRISSASSYTNWLDELKGE